jgi:hypothetical protein
MHMTRPYDNMCLKKNLISLKQYRKHFETAHCLIHWRRRGSAKWATAQGLTCLTPVLVCIEIAFSPYIVAVVCRIHVLLSETDNNEEGIEKIFDKSLWRVENNFLNALHKMLLLT